MKSYLVGGAVRDKLLNIPVKDRDWVVVGATPEVLLASGYSQVGADFPVFLHPQTKEEYALARTERKKGKGYKGFECHAAPDVTLEDDLRRRDLTINAMAMDKNGNITDPFQGQTDLQNRILRHVSEAFIEDPLRILRVARFAARFHHLGFTVADETMALMKEMVDTGEADHLVPERVWQETCRALGEPSPEVYFTTLAACGALAVTMPELLDIIKEPDWERDLILASKTISSPESRLAIILYQFSKQLEPEAATAQIEQLAARIKMPKVFQKRAELCCRFQDVVNRPTQHAPEQLLAFLTGSGALKTPDNLKPFIEISLAVQAPKPDQLSPEDFFANILEALRQIDPKTLLREGFKGKALGAEIERQQLTLIAQCIR
ncbi:MAG: multifunctional CCA tRNA nucleotidyl transferase/2'3'-cyclic phosphodiesterase/2'nucleotidase/phosphatase [Pseudomonadales bacterium]|nr:multifunctional CCA tRNA nucleotidyl transferase/2'3'-cyclic phosphodiesterase/2'nucleotidase/phosphatase [Pseudomonadales bacterium]